MNNFTKRVLCLIWVLAPMGWAQEARKPNVILLTMDTTRADVLGSYGAKHQKTPNLDKLAANGTLYLQAIAPAPLTLPSHASLFTGKTPLGHGIHANGATALSDGISTLAEVFTAKGYATGAFIGSQVLDRRFGLAQGFGFYADEINAADIGEAGYPERDAESVVDDALLWLEKQKPEQPVFMWLHFYDPHMPYYPRNQPKEGSPFDLYAEEVGRMDAAIGRFLAKIPQDISLVAAVGDHGEMMMEHGEAEHGILLYQAVLHVPLILKGPGVPTTQVSETVGIVRLASTLLALVGLPTESKGFGPSLPGFGFSPKESNLPVYSESEMPLNAFGWTPLAAISRGPYRLIVGSEPELYNFVTDPAEATNLVSEKREEARELRDLLKAMKEQAPTNEAQLVAQDPEFDAKLRSLGYASGASRPKNDGVSPKQGLEMMKAFDQAKVHMSQGRYPMAVNILEDLTKRNPNNIPFLSRLAEARMHQGELGPALEAYRHAISLNPKQDFLHLNLGLALRSIDDLDGARECFELVTHLNPRSAMAWLSLAEIAKLKGNSEMEHQVLHHAMGHGVASAPLLTRLAQIELSLKKWGQANRALEAATLLEPGLVPAWLLWGDLAQAQGDIASALKRYGQANRANPADPSVYLSVGKLYATAGDVKNAEKYLRTAVEKDPKSLSGLEASRLLLTLATTKH